MPTRRSGPFRALRAAAIALVSFLLAALGVELGWRLWLTTRGTPYDGALARARVERIADELNDRLVDYGAGEAKENVHGHMLHPYTGFAAEGLQGSLPKFVERFGKKRAGAYFDVVIVGGSVAGMTSHPLRASLPQTLHPHLPEGKVGARVFNLAMGGVKQPQQTTMVAYLLSRGVRPDAIVNIDGFNEVALGHQNGLAGADPVFPSINHWSYLVAGPPPDRGTLDLMLAHRQRQHAARDLADTAAEYGLMRSAVTGGWIRARMQSIGAAASEDLEALNERLAGRDGASATRGIPIPEVRVLNHPLAPVRLSAESWLEASLSLHAMCAARDILYVQALQPTLHDPGSKTLTPEEIVVGDGNPRWIAGVKNGYPLLRERGAELRDRGVRWLDASKLFADVEETLYIDICHYNERGGDMLAEVIADELVRALD